MINTNEKVGLESNIMGLGINLRRHNQRIQQQRSWLVGNTFIKRLLTGAHHEQKAL